MILISFDATKQGLTLTLEGEINCNVECNPLQAQGVAELIAMLEAGEEVPAVTYVPDSVFVAGGTESELGITMTQEVLDGRALLRSARSKASGGSDLKKTGGGPAWPLPPSPSKKPASRSFRRNGKPLFASL